MTKNRSLLMADVSRLAARWRGGSSSMTKESPQGLAVPKIALRYFDYY
jgi:hypothetical protein